ncbi:MAG TPA: ferritin [Chthoniobacterales bacterium]
MITSQPVIQLLNEQIRNEFQSHQIYLALSAWFETTPYKGFAAKYRQQALEEHGHALKIYNFLADRDGRIRILALEEPRLKIQSVLDAAKSALEQEQAVSAQIRNIYKVAQTEEDFETLSFLKWFLDEQVEEERTAKDLVEYVQAAGASTTALLELDQHAATEAAKPSPAV